MKTPSFPLRSNAAAYAAAQGWVGFRTVRGPEGDWTPRYEPGDSPAAAYAASVDFAHHAEVAWVGPEDDRSRVGCVVATVTLSELLEELGRDHIQNSQGRWVRGPGDVAFLLEPLVAELWEVPVASTKPKAAKVPPKKQSAAPVPADESRKRERGTARSPTKLVWEVADRMVGASRGEVVAECVAQGVHPSTASTQFYRWSKARRAAAPGREPQIIA